LQNNDSDNYKEYAVHFYISNQSSYKKSANITITIDDQIIYDKQTWSDTGHNFTIIDKTVKEGSHLILSQENDTSIIVEKEIKIIKEQWIMINFGYDPDVKVYTFYIDIFDEQIGIS